MAMQVTDRPQSADDFLKLINTPQQSTRPQQQIPRTPTSSPKEPLPAPEPQESPTVNPLLNIAGELAKTWLQNQLNKNQLNRNTQSEAFLSVSGNWRGADGFVYSFNQTGNTIVVQSMTPYGVIILQGQGTIQGHQMQFSYQLADGTWGNSSAQVARNGRQITGTAVNQVTRGVYNYILYR